MPEVSQWSPGEVLFCSYECILQMNVLFFTTQFACNVHRDNDLRREFIRRLGPGWLEPMDRSIWDFLNMNDFDYFLTMQKSRGFTLELRCSMQK